MNFPFLQTRSPQSLPAGAVSFDVYWQVVFISCQSGLVSVARGDTRNIRKQLAHCNRKMQQSSFFTVYQCLHATGIDKSATKHDRSSDAGARAKDEKQFSPLPIGSANFAFLFCRFRCPNASPLSSTTAAKSYGIGAVLPRPSIRCES